MTNTRDTSTLEVKDETYNSTEILELSQSARDGKVMGIGLCGLNPSGCYDIVKGIGLQLHNVPFIRIQYDIDPMSYLFSLIQGVEPQYQHRFLDEPPKYKTKCETVFFTGCGITISNMLNILNILSQNYQFTDIKYVYEISPPHHSSEVRMRKWQNDSKLNAFLFAQHSPYQYRLLHSGVDTRFPTNIGMPRFESKSSEFKVPLECYGVIRHRQVSDFLPLQDNKCLPNVEIYLNEYFRQIADASKDRVIKPIMVIAIGIEPTYRKRILEIAQQYSIDIDFCDKYLDYRLPQQGDFFKVLSAMKDKKGLVSFDRTSTQSLLQALSFEAPVMIYSQENSHPEFYAQLVNLVPEVYQPTAQVILGLSDNYELLKDRKKCQKVYELLHLEVIKAHQKFESFREGAITPMIEVVNGNTNSVKLSANNKPLQLEDKLAKIPVSLVSSKNVLFPTLQESKTQSETKVSSSSPASLILTHQVDERISEWLIHSVNTACIFYLSNHSRADETYISKAKQLQNLVAECAGKENAVTLIIKEIEQIWQQSTVYKPFFGKPIQMTNEEKITELNNTSGHHFIRMIGMILKEYYKYQGVHAFEFDQLNVNPKLKDQSYPLPKLKMENENKDESNVSSERQLKLRKSL